MSDEFSIMPNFNITYTHNGFEMTCSCHNKRYNERCHRHEIFFGTANRQKSIKYGLVVFIEPEYHNTTAYGVHFNDDLRRQMQEFAQQVAMEHYKWSKDDFRAVFGKNYID